jgi:hypothetical protein
MNVTYQFLIYVNVLGESTHTIKKTTEALLVTSKEICLEVNAEKTKYTFMSHEYTAGHDHYIHAEINPLKMW